MPGHVGHKEKGVPRGVAWGGEGQLLIIFSVSTAEPTKSKHVSLHCETLSNVVRHRRITVSVVQLT